VANFRIDWEEMATCPEERKSIRWSKTKTARGRKMIHVEFAPDDCEGRPPGRAELTEAYYGLQVTDLSLYVGFAQHELSNVPLLTTGLERLYATIKPSPDH
jgi:hypothetical protein